MSVGEAVAIAIAFAKKQAFLQGLVVGIGNRWDRRGMGCDVWKRTLANYFAGQFHVVGSRFRPPHSAWAFCCFWS